MTKNVLSLDGDNMVQNCLLGMTQEAVEARGQAAYQILVNFTSVLMTTIMMKSATQRAGLAWCSYQQHI
jgi:hypothetical protein